MGGQGDGEFVVDERHVQRGVEVTLVSDAARIAEDHNKRFLAWMLRRFVVWLRRQPLPPKA